MRRHCDKDLHLPRGCQVKTQHAVHDLVIMHSGKEGEGRCHQRTEVLRGKQFLDDEVAYVGGGTGYKVVRLERHQVA